MEICLFDNSGPQDGGVEAAANHFDSSSILSLHNTRSLVVIVSPICDALESRLINRLCRRLETANNLLNTMFPFSYL